MRIEVLIDGEEPKIYPLNKSKIVLGSHESCDIILPSKNVSRKHLVITVRDDQFFVSDQGSTNGSFINEQRLVPGSSVEFTSFFPVRLGTDVLVSLLSDEEAQELGFDSDLNNFAEKASGATEAPVREESTKMISLKDLNKSSTAGLVQKRATTVVKRKTAVKAAPAVKKKKKENKNLQAGIVALMIIAAAAYYQMVLKKEAKEEQLAQTVMAEKQKAPPPVFEGPILRIEEVDIPQSYILLSTFKEKRCIQELEKYLCAVFPKVNQGKWGVVQTDKFLNMVADGSQYEQEAKAYVKNPPPPLEEGQAPTEAHRFYRSDLNLVMVALWVRDNIPTDKVDLAPIKDSTISLLFFDSQSEDGRLISAAFFVPESLLRLRQAIQDKHFESAKTEGAASFAYILDYLRFL